MIHFSRSIQNPIVEPNLGHTWEAIATFNPSVVKKDDKFHLLYRALSFPIEHHGVLMPVSSIGYAESQDGINFHNRHQVIRPEQEWEKFGCEDPRVTFCEDKYYIFYTALSAYPFSAKGIRIGVATTTDFQSFDKHLVTNFNSKAMALFPEKINGKYVAILTVNTDLPPSKIAVAFFDGIEEIWSEKYWTNWYSNMDKHVIPLLRSTNDYVEIGSQPIKTAKGWLLIYSYIQNYFSEEKAFGIEALLLDINDPSIIIGKTCKPLLVPEAEYELNGDVPNVIFPSGAVLDNDELFIYYGAADTVCCVAIVNGQEIAMKLSTKEKIECNEIK